MSEPLHDFLRSHEQFAEELPYHVAGNVYGELDLIKQSVLGKSTLRCVDYRKAAIFLSQVF